MNEQDDKNEIKLEEINDKEEGPGQENITNKEKKIDTSSRNTNEVQEDIKNEDTSQDKTITVTKDEESKINQDEKFAKEASEEGMKMKKRYDELSDPSSQAYQHALNNKIQQNQMIMQGFGQANQSLSQALNGLS